MTLILLKKMKAKGEPVRRLKLYNSTAADKFAESMTGVSQFMLFIRLQVDIFSINKSVYFRYKHSHQKSVARMCSVKKLFSKNLQNSHENTCVGVSFLKVFNLSKKKLRHRYFESCEFCEIFKNTFFIEHLRGCF